MIYDSTPLPAQVAAAADAVTLVGVFELSDGEGLGVTRVVVTPPPGYVTVTGVFNFVNDYNDQLKEEKIK